MIGGAGQQADLQPEDRSSNPIYAKDDISSREKTLRIYFLT